VAEVVLFFAIIAVPLAIGAAVAYLAKPWWWGAVLAVVVFLIAAIAPAPEEGESRVAAGDLVFLLIVAVLVAGLTWVGAWAVRRFRATP
jgi:hypothetical protein